MKAGAKKVSNVGMKARVRQMLILVIAILVGVIISCAAEAQDFHKAKKRHFKAKYKTQINHGNSCHILNKKRNAKHKTPVFASLHHKSKVKPQAEVDTQAQARERTPKFRRVDPLTVSYIN